MKKIIINENQLKNIILNEYLDKNYGIPLYQYFKMDGKQRITTLMNILNNVVPLKKAFNSEKLNPLFKELGSNIYFKDLPEKLQTKLLNRTFVNNKILYNTKNNFYYLVFIFIIYTGSKSF